MVSEVDLGTSLAAVQHVLGQGKNVILDIDMQGVIQLQNKVKADPTLFDKQPLFIFLTPPSEAELEKRLLGRGTETEESANARLAAAKKEIAWGTTPHSVDHVIVNDDLMRAYQELKVILFK